MQVRGGLVPRVADSPDHLAGADLVPPRDRDTPRCEVRIESVRLPGPHDYVVPCKTGGVEPSPREPEHERVLQREPGLPHGVEPVALRHAVHGLDDLAVEGRMDRLPPSVRAENLVHIMRPGDIR